MSGHKLPPLAAKTSKTPRNNTAGLITGAPSRELLYRPTLDGWTPRKAKIAQDAANSGFLQKLADLVDVIRVDDRTEGVLGARTLGLLGLPLKFLGGNEAFRKWLEAPPSGEGEWAREHSEAEMILLQTWGILLGVGVAQRVPLPRRAGQKQRYRLETWNPRALRCDLSPNAKVRWYIMTADGEEPIIPGAGKWVLYTPYGSHMPWQNGKWRSLVFPWLLKRFALEDRANHSEVAGSPTWVGKSPQGATERQRNRFLSQLIGLGRKGRFVLPEGWDLVLREASGRTWEIYSEAIVWADQAITIILAGQVVTTEGSPGFSSGNVQDAIKEDFIRFDAEGFSTCLFEQSLTPLGLINGWRFKDIPWPIWNTERPVDREQQARTLEQLGRAVEILDKSLAKDNKRVNVVQLLTDQKVPLLDVPADKKSPTVTIPLAPTDVAKCVKVNEYRRTIGFDDLEAAEGDQFISKQEPSEAEQLKAPTPSEGEPPPKARRKR